MTKPLSKKELAKRKAARVVHHPDRRSTRAAPRGRLMGRARGSVPSFYDRAHPKIKFILRDTPERRDQAKKLLDEKQRGMLKGYWASDSNPLNWSQPHG